MTEQYKIIKLENLNGIIFKYPYVVYRYVKNGSNKPLYSAYKQFRTEQNAIKYINEKINF